LRIYELMYIVSADLDQEELEQVATKLERMTADAGGQILRLRSWGRRRLAYPIANLHEGHYHVAYLQLEPNTILDLRARLALTEEVIRYLLLRAEAIPQEVEAEASDEAYTPPEEESEDEFPDEEDEEDEMDEEYEDTDEEEVGD
jgi:small subunit ribosomal protein S6